MVTTELTDRAELKAKQEFYATLQRHIDAYNKYEEHSDSDSGEDEVKDSVCDCV